MLYKMQMVTMTTNVIRMLYASNTVDWCCCWRYQ